MNHATKKTILIKGGTILSQDPAIGDFERGDVLIVNGVISQVAAYIDADADEVIDASRAMVIPGLIDTHTHLWQTSTRGSATEVIGPEYQANVKRLRNNYNADDKYVSNYVGALELISGGTTTVLDHCHDVPNLEHQEATIQGTRDAGIRSIFAPTMNPRRSDSPSTHQERLETVLAARDSIAANDNGGLLTPGIALTDNQFLNAAGGRWDWIETEVAMARENGLYMTIHTGSVVDQLTNLHAHGALGPDLLPSHSRDFSPHEYDLVVGSGMTLNVTPQQDFRHGLHWHISAAVRRGITLSVGIDSVAFGGGDMLTQLYYLAEMQRGYEMLTEKIQGRDERRRPGLPLVSPEDVLRMATLDGAKALGLDDRIGSIAPGKRADLVLIAKNPFGVGRSSPAAQIVHFSDRSHVDTVIVDGVVRKRAGQLVDVDMDALFEQVEESTNRIFATPIDNVLRVWWAPSAEAKLWDDNAPDAVPTEDLGTAAAERN